jgi:flavin reductase (DIM6/NTAB) family NADH-FMN oxidoreductase RutF
MTGDVLPATTVTEGFRVAMRGLAKGVVIISTRGSDGRHAMAATAVTSLSFDPPSMLICVNQNASIFAALIGGSGFYVNILSRTDQDMAGLCSGKLKGEARFGSKRWTEDETAWPYLTDAQAAVRCVTERGFLRYGTHGIFIGRVTDVRTVGDIDPLIYVDGRYSGLPQEANLPCSGTESA